MRAIAITLFVFAVSLSCAPLKAPGGPVSNNQPVIRGEAADRIHRYLERIQHFGFSGAILVATPRGVLLRKDTARPAPAGE